MPADDKPNARLIVSQAVVEALDAFEMRFPELDEDEQRELVEMRRHLAAPDAKGGRGRARRRVSR